MFLVLLFGYRYGVLSCSYHSSPFFFFKFHHTEISWALRYMWHKASRKFVPYISGIWLKISDISAPKASQGPTVPQSEYTVIQRWQQWEKNCCLSVSELNILTWDSAIRHLLDLDVTAELLDWQSLSNDPQGSHIPSVCCLQLPKDHPPSSCLGFHDSLKICSKHSWQVQENWQE